VSKPKAIQLSVTELAIPSPRLGSLESDAGFGVLPMVGTEIHQAIQAERLRMGTHYVIEKWVTHTFPAEPFKFAVSGRIDGMQLGAPTVIEEIKSSYSPEALIERLKGFPDHPYNLQLRTYGYIHWLNSGREPELKLIVVNSRTRAMRELEVALDVVAYEDWLKRRLKELVEEERQFEALRAKRVKTATTLAFPFSNPRTGQKELIAYIDKHLSQDSRALLQAPTGLGKTVGVLYPSLKHSLAQGQKTIYVTAKNSQHTVAEDAVERIQDTGGKIKSVTVHAKSKMCLKDEVFCNPVHCEFARDYYTKIHQHKVVEKLAKKKRLTEKAFKDAGREFEVCPFELQLECVPRADVVVCDYNYVFSPRHILGRLNRNGYGSTAKANLVIDEAHNLAARANDYYSSRLVQSELEKALNEATFLPEPLWDKIRYIYNLCSEMFDELAAALPRGPGKIEEHQLRLNAIEALGQELLRGYLDSGEGLRTNDPVLRFCNLISDFGAANIQIGDEFVRTFNPQTRAVKITCFDSSKQLTERYKEFANVVAFSATLKPFDFHLRTLGMEAAHTATEEFHSPFPKENRKILIIPQISTKMRDRQSNYGKVRDIIERVVALKPGNYFVFFPSFEFLNQVANLVNLPDFRVLRQERDMRRRQIDEYLENLREETPTIIFAVQGGVFAEGVDYPGRMLIGAMIVGPALPVFDYERELLRDYFDRNGGSGFDYAYTYPAMTRVVQSAGRVIRSAEDRGLIILMDRRFMSENYINAMPSDWTDQGTETLVSTQILQDVQEFWNEP
jgi:DNA excision repair protein ERCC-2